MNTRSSEVRLQQISPVLCTYTMEFRSTTDQFNATYTTELVTFAIGNRLVKIHLYVDSSGAHVRSHQFLTSGSLIMKLDIIGWAI